MNITENLNLTPKQRDGIWRYIQAIGKREKHKDWPEVFIIYDIEDIENFINENTVEEYERCPNCNAIQNEDLVGCTDCGWCLED